MSDFAQTDLGDVRDEALALSHYLRLIDELRAEANSLRVVLKAVETRKHRTGAHISLSSADGRLEWTVTASTPEIERTIAEALAKEVTETLAGAMKIAGFLMKGIGYKRTGTGRGLEA